MELVHRQDNFLNVLKWITLVVCLYLSVMGLKSFHSYQLQKIISVNMVSVQKSSLITQMHNEMLLITRSQLQILHASNEKQIRDQLLKLSSLVSDYLTHYYQLEQLVDSSDKILLEQFKTGFEQWHEFNQNILSYANIVADTGFINTLKMIDLAFSQFEHNPEDSIQLIAKIKFDINSTEGVSN